MKDSKCSVWGPRLRSLLEVAAPHREAQHCNWRRVGASSMSVKFFDSGREARQQEAPFQVPQEHHGVDWTEARWREAPSKLD